MKKFYSIFMVMLMAAVGMVAHAQEDVQAKTFTIKTNDAEACYVYNMADYSYPQWADGQMSITFSGQYDGVNIYANSGYEITGVQIDGKDVTPNHSSYHSVNYDAVNDGSVVNVTMGKQKDKTLYIVGDPAKITIKDFNYNDLTAADQVDGKWELTVPAGSYASAEIDAVEGYMISSALADDGTQYVQSATEYFYVSATQLTAEETTVVVETKTVDELYPGKITVNVVGNQYMVSFRLNGQYSGVNLQEGTTVVRYNPETDVPFNISHSYNSSYNPQSLYAVKLNGTDVTANDDLSFTVTPATLTDDVVDIQVEAPAVEVPVTFTFEGDGRQAIRSIYMNENIDPANWDSFAGVLGKTMSIDFNLEGYELTKFTLNGEDQQPSEYGYYNVQCVPESGMNFVIGAIGKPGYKTTIICENYQSLVLASDYEFSKPYALTGVETEIEVKPGEQYLYFKALDGYRVNAIYDLDNNTYSTTGQVYIDGEGKTICFEVGEFRRDETAVVFIEDTQWNYFRMAIAPYTYDITEEYSFDKDNIHTGYNFINFNSKTDLPFGFSTYDATGKQAELYLNGEKLEGLHGNYPALNEIKDGDVLKVMTQDAAASNALTYTFDGVDASKVAVVHDHKMTVDHSQSHNVFAGTAVHFVPAEGVKIAVKANDEALEANAEGVFAHTVAGNVNYVITDASAVADIAVDAAKADTTIYNLQGMPVGNDLQALPAGLYISAGQKVLKK